ncbi:MAG: glycogen-debranching protein, partial [Planctomycetales bacterium]|nr:glycogen-debranching protein [Planctomycetales bacterium]
YNQDNETSWLDWGKLESNRDVFRFFQCMIAFRKAHPSIARTHFWREDVAWYGAQHNVDMSGESRTLAYCLHGESQADTDIYAMTNSSLEPVQFGIHEGAAGQWRRVIDTSLASPDDFADSNGKPVNSSSYVVAARSVVVLVRNRQLNTGGS